MKDKLILDGCRFQDANIEVIDSFYTPSTELIPMIDKAWNDIKKRGAVWNGIIYRLYSISKFPKTIIRINKISYKNHITSNIYGIYIKNQYPSYFPNGIYVTSYIRTIDNCLMFSEKSNSSILQNGYNLIGGTCNKDELEILKIDDFFATWKMEFFEELSLDLHKIKRNQIIGVYQSSQYRIAIVYFVDLLLSSNEIQKLSRLNNEHKRLIFVPIQKFWSKYYNENRFANVITTTRSRAQKYLV
jgi:8-oxo-dGTP pyrophosphatase MutT (NUDIX family)